MMAVLLPVLVGLALVAMGTRPAQAVPGDLLGTVTLPGNPPISVGGTFDGTYYITVDGIPGTVLQIYQPPVGGTGAASLVATKNVVDAANNPVAISAVSWDAGRGMLWAAANNQVWLINIGDPTVSGNALATFQFNPNVGGSALVDGLAYDNNDDTLYYSPDVDLNVYQFSLGTGANPPLGTLMNTVAPKNAAGVADGQVSGVAIGSANTLYIGRDGAAEIRRVDKTTGAFVSNFATTSGRVEDLVCDPFTYAPLEAILSKDAFNSLYEAFEVEPGTCPGIRPIDHYLGYRAVRRTPTPPNFRDATLTDQFVTEDVQIRKPDRHYNPVTKVRDDEVTRVQNPEVHLVGYRLRTTLEHTPVTVDVTNQLGTHRLTTSSVDRLLVPSTKKVGFQGDPPDRTLEDGETLPDDVVDHFKCYTVKHEGRFTPIPVDFLNDQFIGLEGATVVKPLSLCNPVDKTIDGETTEAKRPADHLACYLLEPRLRLSIPIQVNNQLDPEQLELFENWELCVPSTKTVVNGSGSPG